MCKIFCIFKPLERGKGTLCSVVTPRPDGGFDARVVDGKGAVILALSGYRTMELPESVDDQLLEPIRMAFQ